MPDCDIVWCETEQRFRLIPISGPAIPDASPSTKPADYHVVPHSQWPNQIVPEPAGCWYSPSQTVDVHGYKIGGMVYVGTRLYSLNGNSTEPALIDPSLPVRSSGPDYNGKDFPYGPPSYRSLSPQARGRYLEWLRDGRQDARISMGFVFLFFYGLERRLFDQNCSEEERSELCTEIKRLRSTYARDPAFDRSSYALSDFIAAKEMARAIWIGYHAAPEVRPRGPYDPYSDVLRVGLGRCADDSEPVPSRWALAWAESHAEFRKRTPAQRCPEEFEDLFELVYGERFPNGLGIASSEEEIVLRYIPAGPSFGAPIVIRTRIPNVARFDEIAHGLSEIAMDCQQQLDAYSRYLGRRSACPALAIALLPTRIFDWKVGQVLREFWSWLEITLHQTFAVIPAAALLSSLGIEGEKVPQKGAGLIAELLERLNVGVEPDPRVGNSFAWPGSVVLFRIEPSASPIVNNSFSIASTLLSLAVASGILPQPGRIDVFEQRICTLANLSPDERLRLRARRLWLLENGIELRGLRKTIGVLSSEMRRTIGEFLIELAVATGKADPSGINALTKAFRLLAVDTGDLVAAVHAQLTTPASSARTQSPVSATPDVAIDSSRVATLLSETEQVSTLLQEVFLEEDAPEFQVTDVAERPFQATDPHARFLTKILTKESWSRADLLCAAGECGLLLEGAVDVLNELALERYGDLLVEGDDPMYLNLTVAGEFQQ